MQPNVVTNSPGAAGESLTKRRTFLTNLVAAAGSATGSVACGGGGDVQPAKNSGRTATSTIEDPLSAGRRWSNNTQGLGGINYNDSFAFVPGFGPNQYCAAVLYKASGCNSNSSGANHEVEIILSCRTANGYHRSNEFLLNAGGDVDILSLDGGLSDFRSICVNTGNDPVPVDSDVNRPTEVANVSSTYINGALVCNYSGPSAADRIGIGIAGFIRPGATHNEFGVRRVVMGSL